MQIRFYANMRTVIGLSSLEINDSQVDSFRELLLKLTALYPDVKAYLLDVNGELRPEVPVYVDGRNPRLFEEGIDAPLQADSVVSFFSPISSGKMNVEGMRRRRSES
jgi:molybdopterin converting factor small subunit